MQNKSQNKRGLDRLSGRHSTLSIDNKRLLYDVAIVKPIRITGIKILGCAIVDSKKNHIERCRRFALRTILIHAN